MTEDEDENAFAPKYSTKLDQQLGQGEQAQSSEDPDYENDDFEDMDDDFNTDDEQHESALHRCYTELKEAIEERAKDSKKAERGLPGSRRGSSRRARAQRSQHHGAGRRYHRRRQTGYRQGAFAEY